MHKERIKAVVECCRISRSRSNTTAVIELPMQFCPKLVKYRKHANYAQIYERWKKNLPTNPKMVKIIKKIAPHVFAVDDIFVWFSERKITFTLRFYLKSHNVHSRSLTNWLTTTMRGNIHKYGSFYRNTENVVLKILHGVGGSFKRFCKVDLNYPGRCPHYDEMSCIFHSIAFIIRQHTFINWKISHRQSVVHDFIVQRCFLWHKHFQVGWCVGIKAGSTFSTNDKCFIQKINLFSS